MKNISPDIIRTWNRLITWQLRDTTCKQQYLQEKLAFPYGAGEWVGASLQMSHKLKVINGFASPFKSNRLSIVPMYQLQQQEMVLAAWVDVRAPITCWLPKAAFLSRDAKYTVCFKAKLSAADWITEPVAIYTPVRPWSGSNRNVGRKGRKQILWSWGLNVYQ